MTGAVDLRTASKGGDAPLSGQQRYLFIFAGGLMAGLLSPLAAKLRQEHDVHSILLAAEPSRLPSPKIFDFRPDTFAEVMTLEQMMRPATGAALPAPAELAARAADIERRLGVGVLDLIRCDRHFGRSFITGNWFYRSRFAKQFSFEQTLDLAIRLVDHFEALVDRYRPLAVIGYPGTLVSNALISVAEAKGTPMLSLTAPRRANLFYWQADRFGKPAGFDEVYATLLNQDLPFEAPPQAPEDGPERVQQLRQRIARQTGLLAFVRRLAVQLRKSLPGYIKMRPARVNEYTVSSRIKYELLAWGWRRRVVREDTLLDKLPSDLPFVFFPLTMEPEASLQVEAQWADFQLGIIDMLAKTVPAGWYVVVKEHPAQGIPRVAGFRKQLRQYPNVLQAAVLESAERYIARAQAVVTINGTVGVQAASIGKPVLTLHRQYLALPLPQVRLVDSYETMRRALRDVRDDRFPAMAERMRAYHAFGEAMSHFEFPVDDPKLLAGAPSDTVARSDDFGRLYAYLCRALGLTADSAADTTPPRQNSLRA